MTQQSDMVQSTYRAADKHQVRVYITNMSVLRATFPTLSVFNSTLSRLHDQIKGHLAESALSPGHFPIHFSGFGRKRGFHEICINIYQNAWCTNE